MERMTYAADDKEDTGSSMDSNIHLVGFDTSDEDVFHATQVVEHQLSQEDKSNSQCTDNSDVRTRVLDPDCTLDQISVAVFLTMVPPDRVTLESVLLIKSSSSNCFAKKSLAFFSSMKLIDLITPLSLFDEGDLSGGSFFQISSTDCDILTAGSSDLRENSLQKKNSGKSDSSISEDSSSKKDDNILKPENSSENLNSNVVEKTVKSNIEENISEKGASSAEKEVNCSSEKGDNFH
jgi:hypothetical protein